MFGVKLSKSREGFVATRMNLCLVVKSKDGAFVEDLFKHKVNTGTFYGNLAVVNESARFKPLS